MKYTAIVLLSLSVIALGLLKYPSYAHDTAANGTADVMLAKLKRAYPSFASDQYSNAQKILTYAVQIGIVDHGQLAYVLSTAIGESGLRPIKEKRCRPGTACYKAQEKYWYTGYMGRGYVQLTWKSNYQKFGTLLHIDLVGNPDLALNPTYAGEIIDIGMQKGMFTGVGLSHYINGSKQDFYNARRIINGTDRAQDFANRAVKILNA